MDFRKLFSFDGRIVRGTHWKLVLINLAIWIVTFGIAGATENGFLMFLAVVVALVMSVAGIATMVKRWHDRDKSGAWYFIMLVPLVGPIWAVIECGFLEGTHGPNQYGTVDSGSPFATEPLPRRAAA